ncbi:hypothetical protein MGSAQ_002953 [marine sediment metagenome]|uniref:Uncharacterized protein n=1 Tax=marine sediment metagenome TaxID=412755 RepID=A0A1B6NQ39_9ZZZZ
MNKLISHFYVINYLTGCRIGYCKGFFAFVRHRLAVNEILISW